MNRARGKLTYANVISTICLLLLLGGGTAYAASQLGRESVGTKQLAKEAVTPPKLSKASKAILTGPRGATGPQGARGDTGAAGQQGVKGDTGVKGDPGTPATALWARVGNGGNLEEQSAAVVKAEPHGTGIYLIYFDRDVSGCAYSGTVTHSPGWLVVEPDPTRPEAVFVETFNTAATNHEPRSFSLAVFCG